MRTHRVLTAYAKMGLWINPFGYTEEHYHADAMTLLDPISSKGKWMSKQSPASLIAMHHVWFENPEMMDEICRAKGITRRQFLRSLAFPKPSMIENTVFSSEIKNHFGDVSDVPGFDANGRFMLPRGQGLFVPVKANGQIRELRFYSMREMLQPAIKQAA